MTDALNRVFRNRLAPYLRQFAGSFSCCAFQLGGGEELSIKPDAIMPPASVIKLAAMVATYQQAEKGTLDLSARIQLTTTRHTPGSGILRYLDDPIELSLRDLINLMIVVSDNAATRAVLKRIGIDSMNETMRALGYINTQLIFPERANEGARGQGTTTARELCRLMAAIAQKSLISIAACDAMKKHLAGQQYNDQIARFLPTNLYATDRGHTAAVRIFNKTGFTLGVRADTAIIEVESDSGFVIATLSADHPDEGFYPDHPGNLINAVAARLVFETWYDNRFRTLQNRYCVLPPLPPAPE